MVSVFFSLRIEIRVRCVRAPDGFRGTLFRVLVVVVRTLDTHRIYNAGPCLAARGNERIFAIKFQLESFIRQNVSSPLYSNRRSITIVARALYATRKLFGAPRLDVCLSYGY